MSTIEHTARILRLMARGVNQISVLAEELGEPKSKIHRYLAAMTQAGLVVRDPVKRHYFLGPLFLQLASDPSQAHQRLAAAATMEMRRIQNLTGETVALHIQLGTQKYCLEEFLSGQGITFTAGKGSYAQIYAGASGKSLLAQMSDNELDHVLTHVPLVKVGQHTITDRAVLIQEVRAIRLRGYATSIGERVPQAACVSAMVTGYDLPVALSVFGPDFRFAERMNDVVQPLLEAARIISGRLGPVIA